MSDKTWEEFNTRFTNIRGTERFDFYGCVAPDGAWFDSSESFDCAVHFCARSAEEFDLSPEAETHWMETKGKDLGYSIIHSKMLEQMYEKGLLK
jgi:hypothetical protein